MKDETILILMSGMVIGMAIFGVISEFTVDQPNKQKIETLGKSICLEEYGQDFDKMDSDMVLHCKPKLEQYDGLKVSLQEAQQ